MKSIFGFSAIFLLFFIGISCSNNDDDSSTPTPTPTVYVNYEANLTPVVGTGSMASGKATLKLNTTAKTFDITVSYTGIAPTMGHIHRSVDKVIEFPFPEDKLSPSPFTLTFPITDAQIAILTAGQYYVNLHTAAFPSGEISGTLTKTGTSGGGGGGPY